MCRDVCFIPVIVSAMQVTDYALGPKATKDIRSAITMIYAL